MGSALRLCLGDEVVFLPPLPPPTPFPREACCMLPPECCIFYLLLSEKRL